MGVPGQDAEPELSLRAMPLPLPIPENMLKMVRPMLGREGSFEYDDGSHIVILRARPMDLERAAIFITQLCDTYGKALDTVKSNVTSSLSSLVEAEKPENEAVRIEALLLLGERGGGASGETQEEIRQKASQLPLPPEAVNIGLNPGDLEPFAFRSVGAVGVTLLQAVLGGRQTGVTATLEGYRLKFTDRSPCLGVQVEYEQVSAVRSPGPDQATTAEPASTQLFTTQDVRRIEALSSAPKIVFDRPILVGSFSDRDGRSGETVILVIRLKRLETTESPSNSSSMTR